MKRALFLCLVLCSHQLYPQKLTLNDLLTTCGRSNWNQVNDFLMDRGWEYHESSKGDNEHYSTITWSFDKSEYEDKASGWFNIYTFDTEPVKIRYQTFNLNSYTHARKGIAEAGFKQVGNTIKDDEILINYANDKFFLSISTKKSAGSDYESSNTSYGFTLFKKSSVYDPNNGYKVNYHDNGKISEEFTLRDGKYHGAYRSFYDNGNMELEHQMVNGKKHGKSTEYDSDGNKLAEFTYLNGELDGPYKIYKDGKLSLLGSAKSGLRHGAFKEYDSDGKIIREYVVQNDKKEGLAVNYLYDTNGTLVVKTFGDFKNDKNHGLWRWLKYLDRKEILLSFFNYADGVREGKFKRVQGDSIIFGEYRKGMLYGNYQIYKDENVELTGIITGDTSTAYLRTTGYYAQDKENGHWRNFTKEGVVFSEGNYFDGNRTGQWQYRYNKALRPDGSPKPYSEKLYLIENYVNGRLHGERTRFGELLETIVLCDSMTRIKENVDSCVQRVYKKYHEITTFKDGEKYGPYLKKDSTGVVVMQGVYVNGKRDGNWIEGEAEFDPDGNVFYRFLSSTYLQGVLEGEIIEYFNGNVSDIVARYSVKNGELHGSVIKYAGTGILRELATFDAGALMSLIIYDSIGKSVVETYDVKERSDSFFRVQLTKENDDGRVIETRRLPRKQNEDLNPNFLELTYLIQGVPDGPYEIYSAERKIIESGNKINDQNVGLLKKYYYDQGVYVEHDYSDESNFDRFYVIPSGKPYSGVFLEQGPEGKIKAEYKIANGLKHGKSKMFDASGKVVSTGKYVEGALKL